MQISIFNGSPRNKTSNSKILINHFLRGYKSIKKEEIPINFIADQKLQEEHIEIFKKSDIVIIIFPLYTNCMPAIVKDFFEKIYSANNGKARKIGYIVQSGFPEAYQSIFVEKYLQKFTKKMSSEYLGTVIKGGIEGIQIKPPIMTQKIFDNFFNLGKVFAEKLEFDQEIVENMKKPYKLSKRRIFFLKILSYFGLTNFYWDSKLKENNAYEQRFARPYIE